MLVSAGQADILLTYCTSALAARREVPELEIVQVPANLARGADYGVTTLKAGSPGSADFVKFIISPSGQQIPAGHGLASGQ